MILTGKSGRTRRKVCPCAALSTINLALNGLGTNPDLRNERTATNGLKM
jgi:hypothetical protein